MSYNKLVWVNKQTPVNADNMNHIEDGIANVTELVENITEITDDDIDALNWDI